MFGVESINVWGDFMYTNYNHLICLKKILEQNRNHLKKKRIQTSFAFLFMTVVGSSSINPYFMQAYATEKSIDETIEAFPEEEISCEVQNYSPTQVGIDSTDNVSVSNLSFEEQKAFVLQHYQMSEVDYNTFVNAIILESLKSGSYLDQNIVTGMLYDMAMIPNEVKINHILATRGINLDQLSRTSQVVLAEAAYDGKNYVDAFGVTNALNNREVSDSWSRSGQNVFEQAYARGQFSVIKNGRIQKFVNRADLIGYQAFIDCLYLGGTLPMHGYCSFKAWSKSPEGRIAYVTGGNRFDLFDELTPEARARRYCLNDPIQLQYFSMNQEEQYVPVLVVQNE